MRKLALGLVLTLALSAFTPASAQRRKSETKYQTFTQEGETVGPGIALITWLEFQFSCPDPPLSQGVTGYLVELPEPFTTGTGTVVVQGGGTGAISDFSVSIWSRDCEMLVNTQGVPQNVPPGGVFVMVEADYEVTATFTLTATAPVPRR